MLACLAEMAPIEIRKRKERNETEKADTAPRKHDSLDVDPKKERKRERKQNE